MKILESVQGLLAIIIMISVLVFVFYNIAHMGAVCLFVMIAIGMLVTRHIVSKAL